MIDKLLIMARIGRLMAFHSEMSTDLPEDDKIAKLCWARDAGKLQAIMCILDGISMGDNDFMYDSNPRIIQKTDLPPSRWVASNSLTAVR